MSALLKPNFFVRNQNELQEEVERLGLAVEAIQEDIGTLYKKKPAKSAPVGMSPDVKYAMNIQALMIEDMEKRINALFAGLSDVKKLLTGRAIQRRNTSLGYNFRLCKKGNYFYAQKSECRKRTTLYIGRDPKQGFRVVKEWISRQSAG